jgi:hydroxymethylpyrimidine pyrophosphatase-like HAD family hydrolase
VFRLVATDLDGTLLRPDYSVSEHTRAVLARLVSSGVRVVLVTGRPPRWVFLPIEQTGVHGPVVCANGALTFDPDTRSVLDHRTLDPDSAVSIVLLLRKELPGVQFAFEMGLRFGRERSWVPLDPPPDEIVVDDGLVLARQPLTKLLARHPLADAAQLAAVIVAHMPQRATVTWSTPALVEVSGAGVNKATALDRLVRRIGAEPKQVVAFGDMPNDIEMLRWAGLGVAVANAHPDVIEVADEVTASNADDGVAVFLERLFAHSA